MALPKINTFPMYSAVVPSTQKKVRFRPYNVGEEKILLIAYESGENNQIANALLDTVIHCVDNPLKKDELTVFDVEYLFLQIRSKSVGETSNLIFRCEKCEHENPVEVKVDQVKVDAKNFPDKKVKITDDYTMELKFPVYSEVIEKRDLLTSLNSQDLIYQLIVMSLDKLHTPDELINFSEESVEEVEEFLNNLLPDQYSKIVDFITNLPKLSQDVEYDCESCQHHNKYTLEGLNDFF